MTDDAAALRGNWNYPTQVRFGVGRLAKLPMVQDAIAANTAAGLPTGLFAEVKSNPVGKNVEDGLAAYRAGGHDGVIAFGGGSALDAAKAVALMVGQRSEE